MGAPAADVGSSDDLYRDKRLEAGRILRRRITGIGRALPASLPIGTAVVGALLFYIAKVSESSYLEVFGLRPGQVGEGPPNLARIVFPAMIFGTWIAHGVYKGLMIDPAKGSRSSRLFDRLILRGPGHVIATRVLFAMGLIPLATVLCGAYLFATWHGKMSAYSLVHRVVVEQCSESCVFYQRSIYGPKRSPTGELGLPVATGGGRTAIFTAAGTVLMKTDDIQKVTPFSAKVANNKKDYLFDHFVYSYIFN